MQTKEINPSELRKKLFELLQGRKGITNLGIGEPDFKMPKHIEEAYTAAIKKGCTHYVSTRGDPELRREISNKYESEYRLDLKTDSEILVTNGGVEAIYLAISSLVNRGDEVIIPDPGFPLYKNDVLLAGARPIQWNLSVENDFEPNPADLNELVTERTRLVILNHPANPTGAAISKSAAKRIAEIAEDKDLLLLSDEVYEKIIYGGSHVNIASRGVKDRTVTVNSLSKTYAMTGLRVGFATGPAKLIAPMVELHQVTTTCVNAAAQKAAVAALSGSQECIRQMVAEYKKRRDLLVAGLNQIDGISCPKPGGAFYAFPDISGTGISSEQLAAKLLDNAKVVTVPGNAFGSQGEGHLRLSYSASRGKIEEAIGRIRTFLGMNPEEG